MPTPVRYSRPRPSDEIFGATELTEHYDQHVLIETLLVPVPQVGTAYRTPFDPMMVGGANRTYYSLPPPAFVVDANV